MNNDQFEALARAGYNRIPVSRQALADLDTPLSAYMKLADAPYSYLLESVQGGERWGRYSILGLPARTRIVVRRNAITVLCDDVTTESLESPDPLAFVQDFIGRYRVPDLPGLPRFYGGLGRLLRLRRGALRRTSPAAGLGQARSAGRTGHPPAAVRRTGRIRQSVGSSHLHRLRRSRSARRARCRQRTARCAGCAAAGTGARTGHATGRIRAGGFGLRPRRVLRWRWNARSSTSSTAT
jgi:hypothetical protein